ncbi:glycoside hydrolase family 15 protein [Sulfolobus islandicus]|uniref:Glycoside hydrolase 15-related protein n=1 Tax=Saccharolobus islandicus (strain HVE10/4) TaxID=930943 RepID=F0NLT8_SACI0|nr:alpha,alpha-trehalase TreH1 [Sulfolobus islandicus]ADX83856.1 glycoside hydrolase 15-related protein [Sulfolobus islandicus HVE10/4]WCM37440.1 glycoside hydrolase family 15 protein [Sulfolobus islandicus]
MKTLGFISNQITSALIDLSSIVWFPVPKFDSPSVFTRLLDEDGGEFSILPEGQEIIAVKQEYVYPLVIMTVIRTKQGEINITDLIPLGETVIIRKVESEIPFKVVFRPRFYYSLYKPIIGGSKFVNPRGRDCIAFLYDFSGKVKRSGNYVWNFSNGKGYLIANYASDVKHGVFSERGSTLNAMYERSFENTINYWKSTDVKDVKSFNDLYKASIYTMLGSIYAPSGGVVAAPTTSIPEVEGGKRNWDYRFAWIRDSSIIAEALLEAGFIVEARRIINFLLSLINFSSKPFYYPLYTIEGTIPPPERKLRWLSGYKNSKPVRIGNGASSQIQLDIEGFFISALYKYVKLTNDQVFLKDVFSKVKYIGDWIAENWSLKDSGIWEDRGSPQNYTHSKIMMWIALDKIGKLANLIGYADIWAKERDKLRNWIFTNCVKNNYFIRYCGNTDDVDSSLLDSSLYGFIEVNDNIFINTLTKIENDLKTDVFVKRYKTDFMGEAKHPFLLTTVWLARVYMRLEKIDGAIEILDKINKISRELHLVGEHIDVEKGEFTGNFPQIFVHGQLVIAIKELNEMLTDKNII